MLTDAIAFPQDDRGDRFLHIDKTFCRAKPVVCEADLRREPKRLRKGVANKSDQTRYCPGNAGRTAESNASGEVTSPVTTASQATYRLRRFYHASHSKSPLTHSAQRCDCFPARRPRRSFLPREVERLKATLLVRLQVLSPAPRRRKLHIACGAFIMLRIQNRRFTHSAQRCDCFPARRPRQSLSPREVERLKATLLFPPFPHKVHGLCGAPIVVS